jgi:hypothetical protein
MACPRNSSLRRASSLARATGHAAQDTAWAVTAYQKAGVDLAVGLVSMLCVGTVLLVAAGGQWVLDTFGVKVPGQTPGDTNEPAK